MTIFISVASYRDDQLMPTVKDLYDCADNPEDLRFGIVNQQEKNKFDDFSWLGDNAKVINIHYKDAKGAGYARKLAMELYDKEDFFFQIDSHMRFAKGWDTKLKEMYDWCVNDSGTHKIILSQYAAPMEIHTDGSLYFPKGDKDYWEDPSWTSVVNTWNGVWAGNRERMEDFSHPHPSWTVLCALLFCHGSFVEEIPYDERIAFMGEELCIALRSYTRDWKIYAPNEMLAWHWYRREERPKIWKDNVGGRNWFDIESLSQKTQEKILCGEEQGIYGIADYQKYLEYQKMIGIIFESFYENEIRFKHSMSVLNTETEFDEEFNLIEVTKTGYCSSGFHDKCLVSTDCQCFCHGEDK